MRQVLEQLNTTPGVVGSLVTDLEGKVLARAFPHLFDDASLSAVADDLAEGALALGISPGSTATLFLRYSDGIVAVTPLDDALLLLLFTRGSNRDHVIRALDTASARLRRRVAPSTLTLETGQLLWTGG